MFTSLPFRAAATLLALLSLTACNADQITTTLELVVDAAIAAAPAVEASAGVAPLTQQIIATYLQGAQQCTAAAATTLASGTATPAQKAAAVAGECAGLLAPDLPAGTPAATVNAVAAVANALSQFLAQLNSTKLAMVLSHPELARGFEGASKQATAINMKRVRRIQSKAAKLRILLNKWPRS